MPRVDAHPHGHFGWYDLFSKDLEASKAFYAGLFGWSAEDQPAEAEGSEPYTMFTLAGDHVAGGGQMNAEMLAGGAPPSWNAYVCVDELEPVLERVTARGGKVLFGPIDVFEHGRLAYFADPEGAVVALWQAKEHGGTRRADEAGTVCWTELASRDMHAAADFYGSVFGWTNTENPYAPGPGYRVLRSGDTEVGGILQMTDEWGDLPAHWALYFEVDDVDRSAEQVRTLGGAVKHGPFDTPVGRIAVCTDDGGAFFYLMQPADAMKENR